MTIRTPRLETSLQPAGTSRRTRSGESKRVKTWPSWTPGATRPGGARRRTAGLVPVLLVLATAVGRVSAQSGPDDSGAAPAAPGLALAEPIYVDSGPQSRQGDLLVAEGGVRIRYRGAVLEAQYAELDQATKDVVAVGDVVLQEGERRLAGARLEYVRIDDEGCLECHAHAAETHLAAGVDCSLCRAQRAVTGASHLRSPVHAGWS